MSDCRKGNRATISTEDFKCPQCKEKIWRRKDMSDEEWNAATGEFDREHEYFHERRGY